MSITHISVLLDESIALLDLQPHEVIIDGTFGAGGHSKAILAQGASDIRLVCVDLDEAAQARYEAQIHDARATFVHTNFKDVETILKHVAVDHVHKVLLDLGTSTQQLLEDTRGFSFASNTPLSMTFSKAGSHTGFTAADIVNTWSESSIADIIYGYGEDSYARRIAKAIVISREVTPIVTSRDLAAVIEQAISRRGRLHPATKTFQALRIAVNDELATIRTALDAWWSKLAPGGRIAVITFHSLEDRIVKQWMKAQVSGTILTKKPIVPPDNELSINPRSRSAKLRGIEKETTI